MPIKNDIAALRRGELDLDAVKARVRDHIVGAGEDAAAVLQVLHDSLKNGELQDDSYEELTQFVNETYAPGLSGPGDDNSATRLEEPSYGVGGDKTADVDVGSNLRDRFILDEVVGVGGMGTVYRGRDVLKIEARDRDPHVAIKVLNENFKQRPEAFVALQREASRQQRLAHPNIATVYDFDRSEGVVFITMEYLSGDTLDKLIKDEAQEAGGLPLARVLPILEAMCSALSHAHKRNIVHADFKPGNCFITDSGHIKVLDFGIARAMKDPNAPMGDHTLFDPRSMGALTPAYASPEMLSNSADADPRDDVYALACVTYELLSGRHPFHRIPADQAMANDLKPARLKKLSRRQNEALAQALAFKREDRTPSVDDFLVKMRGRHPSHAGGGTKTYWPWLLGGSIASAAVFIGFWLPTMWDERGYQQVALKLQSAESSTVDAGLAELNQLAPEFLRRGLLENRGALLPHFQDEVNGLLGVPDEIVDYPEVDRILDRARNYYPDSLVLTELTRSYQQRKNAYMGDLSSLFDAYLGQGFLLPNPAADDLHDLLARIAIVDPISPLLSDSRIPGAYADVASQLLSAENYQGARQFVDAGLVLMPDSPGLADLNDRLASIEQALALEQEVALAAEVLVTQADAVTLMPQLRDLAGPYAHLQDLDADHPALAATGATLAEQFAEQIETVTSSASLSPPREFLELYEDVWVNLGMASIPEAVRQQQRLLMQRQDELVVLARLTLADPNLASEDGRSLSELLVALTSIAAEDVRIAALQTEAVDELRDRAERSITEENWDLARAELARAQEFVTTDELQARLDEDARRVDSLESQAQQRIAELERQRTLDREAAQARAEQERQLALQRAQDEAVAKSALRVAESLAGFAMDEPVASMRRVRQRMQALQRLDADSQMLNSAELELQRKLVAAIGQQTDVAAALPVLAQVKSEFGSYAALTDLETQLLDRQRAEQAALRQSRIDDARSTLATVLADPSVLSSRSGRRDAVTALQGVVDLVGEQDPVALDAKTAFVAAYTDSALSLAQAQRFSAAREILDAAGQKVPGNADIAQAQQNLDAQQVAFQERRAAREQQAKVAALEDRFKNEVKAAQLSRARGSLAELQALDADNPLVTTTGRPMLADAYAAQIRQLTTNRQLTRADDSLAQGRLLMPEDSRWDVLQNNIELARIQLRVTSWFDGTSGRPVATIRQYIEQLERERANLFPALSDGWADAVVDRLSGLQSERDTHNRLLVDASSLLPGNALLAGVEPIPAPVRAPVAAVQPALAVSQTVEEVAQPVVAEVVPAPVERQPAVEIDLTPPPPEVLSLANISGRWCADQLELDFSADTMAFTVNKRRLDYTVSSYEYEQDLVRVSWRDRRVGMIFEFGRFSEDGGRMTQLRGRRADGGNWQTYNRPLQRCP